MRSPCGIATYNADGGVSPYAPDFDTSKYKKPL